MKKVVNVNLNGNAYQLEDEGFDALTDYFDSARLSLAGNPDLEEIMSDLEQSIADKMNRFLGRGKTVVTTAEIEEIVEEMGPVDGEADLDVAATGGRESRARDDDSGSSEEREPRKLFKLTGDDEKMLAGVCAGLSAYFGLDVTIVRILFLALIFATSGLAILAYIALAIVIPPASTPEQVARAYGVPFDARGVIDRARARFGDMEQGRHSKSQQRYRNRRTRAGLDGIGSLLSLIVVLFAILIGLWLSTAALSWLPSPVYLGPMHYGGGWPWWMTVLMVVAGVFFVGWIFGGNGGEGRSRLGSLLVKTIQVFLILFIIYLAYRTLPFVRQSVDALVYMGYGGLW